MEKRKGVLVDTLNQEGEWEIHHMFDICEDCQNEKAAFVVVDKNRNVFFLCAFCQDRLKEE